jgi:cytochrome c1
MPRIPREVKVMAQSKTGSVNRRGFLTSAGVTAAALVANPAPPASAAAKAPQEPARNATAPVVTMPPYTSKVVTDQELADIYAYLKTIQPPPALKDIPLLAR